MSLTSLAFIGADLLALIVMVAALYVPRHSRKDLVAAYVGVNVGVLAVTSLLSTASVGAGLGLGLFGVLSIIRLRSTELAQHEVAYFFAALALGLLGGIQTASIGLTATLMALVVASLWIGDHPAVLRRNRHQVVLVDRAIADEHALAAHLEALLGGTVRSLEVQRLDVVNDTTLVDVRYQLDRPSAARRTTGTLTGTADAPTTVPAAHLTAASSAVPPAYEPRRTAPGAVPTTAPSAVPTTAPSAVPAGR